MAYLRDLLLLSAASLALPVRPQTSIRPLLSTALVASYTLHSKHSHEAHLCFWFSQSGLDHPLLP